MSTLKRHYFDPRRIVANARMNYSAKQKFTLVVEGVSDFRFFGQWVNGETATINYVDGKENVLGVWKTTGLMNVDKLIFISDLDYDYFVGGKIVEADKFIYISSIKDKGSNDIEGNDLETTLIQTKALLKLLLQKLDNSFTNEIDKVTLEVNRLRDLLRLSGALIGAYRAADQIVYNKHKRSVLGTLGITDVFFNANTLTIDDVKLKNHIRSTFFEGSALNNELCEIASELYDKHNKGWMLCRGHDLTEMLAQYLTTKLPRRIGQREIEEGLRMSCEGSTIKSTKFGKRILNLEEKMGKKIFSL